MRYSCDTGELLPGKGEHQDGESCVEKRRTQKVIEKCGMK